MPFVNTAEWDDYLKRIQDVHILQTSTWGSLKKAFGWGIERIITHNPDGDIGAQVLFRRVLPFFSIAYIPKGPVFSKGSEMTDQSWGYFLREVDELCKKKRSILLKVEPDLWEPAKFGKFEQLENPNLPVEKHKIQPIPNGFIQASHTIQPPRTIVINISASEEDILKRMKQKTRYNIKLAQKKGIEVHSSDDLEGFYRLMTMTGERDSFGVHSFEYFKQAFYGFEPGNKVILLLASYNKQLLAGLMAFRSGQRAWYFYGASSNERREFMPAYLLQWEAIRWAKANGCVEYDLWGIPDAEENELEAHFADRSDSLWGVYRFKRGFGGEIRRASGPWDRVYQPLLYKIYRWRTGKIAE